MSANEHELRELDAWIAEHVMGWEYKLSGSDPYEDGLCWHNTDGKFPCELPHYTTDPASAMQVLEKCLEKKNSTRGLLELMKWNDSKFSIYSGDDCQSTAETLPLAICRFAKQLF